MACYIYRDCICGKCPDTACDIGEGVRNDKWRSMLSLRLVHRIHGEGVIVDVCSFYKEVWIHFDLKGSRLYSLKHFLNSRDFILKVTDETIDYSF